MTGAEYLTASVLAGLWQSLDVAFDAELAESKGNV
jgi:non-specific serine/threonine protein kinase